MNKGQASANIQNITLPFSLFMDEFVAESDRAAVILGTAMIDAFLGRILDKFLLPNTSTNDDLLDGDSPLANFSARIKICHRLGLIDDKFTKLLNILRKMRNNFAHDVTHSSLATGSARDRVKSMASQFLGSEYFQSLVGHIAKVMERENDDQGVVFRATLAVFYIELNQIEMKVNVVQRPFLDDIVERMYKSKPPESSDNK